MDLGPVEVRVLGALLEKERTTPDAYPLTLNAVVAACNQTTNRAPIMRVEPGEARSALDSLKARGWLRVVHPSHGARSERYRQVADEALGLSPGESAVLCLLCLRGPQTPGELKARSDRLHPFRSVDEVQRALESLAERGEPFAARLPRRLGQKELRWAHLLSGEPQDLDAEAVLTPPPREDRLGALEARVAVLEERLARLEGSGPPGGGAGAGA